MIDYYKHKYKFKPHILSSILPTLSHPRLNSHNGYSSDSDYYKKRHTPYTSKSYYYNKYKKHSKHYLPESDGSYNKYKKHNKRYLSESYDYYNKYKKRNKRYLSDSSNYSPNTSFYKHKYTIKNPNSKVFRYIFLNRHKKSQPEYDNQLTYIKKVGTQRI